MDRCGRLWTPVDTKAFRSGLCGRLWTPLGDLRIRWLGVRVPPGVLQKPMHGKANRMTELPRPSDVWEPIIHSDGLAGDANHSHAVDLSSSHEDVTEKRDDDRTEPRRPGQERRDIVVCGRGINVKTRSCPKHFAPSSDASTSGHGRGEDVAWPKPRTPRLHNHKRIVRLTHPV